MKKIDFRKGRMIALILFLIGFVLIIVSCCINSQNKLGIILFAIGFVLFILAFIAWIVFVRCPECRGLFTLRESMCNFCPHCGIDLNNVKR